MKVRGLSLPASQPVRGRAPRPAAPPCTHASVHACTHARSAPAPCPRRLHPTPLGIAPALHRTRERHPSAPDCARPRSLLCRPVWPTQAHSLSSACLLLGACLLAALGGAAAQDKDVDILQLALNLGAWCTRGGGMDACGRRTGALLDECLSERRGGAGEAGGAGCHATHKQGVASHVRGGRGSFCSPCYASEGLISLPGADPASTTPPLGPPAVLCQRGADSTSTARPPGPPAAP